MRHTTTIVGLFLACAWGVQAWGQGNAGGQSSPGGGVNPGPGVNPNPPTNQPPVDRPNTTGNADRPDTTNQSLQGSGGEFDRPRNLQRSSELLGGPITRNGRNIGRMEDMMVDVDSGRIAYGINSFDSGSRDNLYPVPWSAGRFSNNRYELDVREDRLREAPNFPRGQWPNFNNDQFTASTFQSYNQTPWWNEVNTPASAAANNNTDRTQNQAGPTDIDRGSRSNVSDRNGTRGSDAPGSERVTTGRNTDTNTTRTDRTARTGDRNGTRGSDRPGSERVTSGTTNADTNKTGTDRTARTGDRNGTRGSDRPGSERVTNRDTTNRDTTNNGNDTTGTDRTARTGDRNGTRGSDRPGSERVSGHTNAGDTAKSSTNTRDGRGNNVDQNASANARARTATLGSDVGQNRGDYRDRWSQRPTGLHRMSEIRGTQIVGSDGTRLGEIREVVVDPQTGRVTYAITGDNQRQVAIPWNALRRGTGDTFELNIDSARFRNAPTLDPNTNMTESRWAENIHRYYTVSPYWENR